MAFYLSKFQLSFSGRVHYAALPLSIPVLDDALVNFDCEIEQIQEVGTHTIFICRIVAIQQSEHDQSLVYFNRSYHHVGQTEVA